MAVRGIRGAITVEHNTSEEILQVTKELLIEIVNKNDLKIEDICSVFLTLTDDLNAEFPALAARQLGWEHVPLLCAKELSVSHGLPKCIRVMLHVNTDLTQKDIKHVYLRKAASLRPDLS
ncbi:chorismate mutase [Peptococcaceae bacterium]|nr:chorismate mutase [Peptococcaceae bacterium]